MKSCDPDTCSRDHSDDGDCLVCGTLVKVSIMLSSSSPPPVCLCSNGHLAIYALYSKYGDSILTGQEYGDHNGHECVTGELGSWRIPAGDAVAPAVDTQVGGVPQQAAPALVLPTSSDAVTRGQQAAVGGGPVGGGSGGGAGTCENASSSSSSSAAFAVCYSSLRARHCTHCTIN
jgi:hypothetical protein